MLLTIGLAVLAVAAVVIGVLGEAKDLKKQKWKAVSAWGYAAIVVGVVVSGLTVAESWSSAEDQRRTLDEVSSLNSELAEARQQIVDASRQEGTRLRPSDFQMRMMIDYRPVPAEPLPETIRVEGRIGQSHYEGEFVNVKTPRNIPHIPGRRRPATTGYRYCATNLTFGNLQKYPYLQHLQGEEFTARIDFSQFPPCPSVFPPFRLCRVDLDLYVQGRHFRADSVDLPRRDGFSEEAESSEQTAPEEVTRPQEIAFKINLDDSPPGP